MRFDDRTYFGIPAITVEYSRTEVENLSFSGAAQGVGAPVLPGRAAETGGGRAFPYPGTSPSAFIFS